MRILRDTLVAVLNLEDDLDVVAHVAVIPATCSHRSPGLLDWPPSLRPCGESPRRRPAGAVPGLSAADARYRRPASSFDGSGHAYLRFIGLPLSRAGSPPGGGTS